MVSFSIFSQEEPYFSKEEIEEKVNPYFLEKSRRCVQSWHEKNDAFTSSKPDTPVRLVYDNSFEESMEPSVVLSPNAQDVVRDIHVIPVFLKSSIYYDEINGFDSFDDCECCISIISCCKAGCIDD